jgi:hypothetical protein
MRLDFQLLSLLRFFLLMALGLFLLPGGAGAHAGQTQQPPAKPPRVTIYLHNGTDVSGTLLRVTDTHYEVRQDHGHLFRVPMRSYQGMVLDTLEEKKVSERITTDFIHYMTAARYNFDLRQALDRALAPWATILPKNCGQAGYPVLHFQVGRRGQIKHPVMLAETSCAGNAMPTLLKALDALRLEPLPVDFTGTVLPVNFVWRGKLPPALNSPRKSLPHQ